ncbi:uncharacterized protein LOC111808265 [Cucurbita pepo subsp. pepo]|uniref:uncharacterized protein LOC111808265 n=1 Tax=Cucurbita pepo subsp. pepo TaxID=3664 RepID=UPI000C9D4051|nr:uncharacterized protein LOC111808265 [Cucurbita pepo subsp. pepo]
MPPPKRLCIKRTASQKEILFDIGGAAVAEPQQVENPSTVFDHRLLFMLSSSNNRRNSDEFPWSSNYLRVCCLCRRSLVAGRDIYMYKGDSGFCSAECREQQMNQDEAKEKRSRVSKKGPGPTAVTKASTINGETVAAT